MAVRQFAVGLKCSSLVGSGRGPHTPPPPPPPPPSGPLWKLTDIARQAGRLKVVSSLTSHPKNYIPRLALPLHATDACRSSRTVGRESSASDRCPLATAKTTLVGRVVADSREVQQDEVFWGLVGCGSRAHFAEEAFVRGAAGVVVSGRRVEPWAGRWSLEVDDPQEALWELAAWSRNQFTAPLVAVTGSVGKSTTRQMIDTVLGYRLSGSRPPKISTITSACRSHLLGVERWHQYAVVELAASGPGEIARLARLARPRFGVITNIGQAHWGGSL